MIYGYCRISRKSQNIERQIRNIKNKYPDAHIIQEAFTGTKIVGRKELDKLLKIVKPNDTIVFDSASRMSRNYEEAVVLYDELFNNNINLIFLKEPHINSDVYKDALKKQIEITIDTGNESTDNFIKSIIDSLNKLLLNLQKNK